MTPRSRTLVFWGTIVAAVVAIVAAVLPALASAESPGATCTGTAPDENGHVTLDCVIPMPAPVTVTVTQTVTATPSSSATSSPTTTATTPPVTTPPATTTAPGPTATSTPTETPTTPPATLHGRDITETNTGPQPGWCPAGVQLISTRVRTSQLPRLTCLDLRGGLTVDSAVTIQMSTIKGVVSSYGPRITLQWVTVDATGDEFGIEGHVDCYRCKVFGGSDGIRFDGTNLVESHVRVRLLSSADHNDGVQAYLADEGGSILRSNIDTRPVNASRCGNAAIFIADRSKGQVMIRDNYLLGGGYTLRLHESATYRVTGNILAGWCFGPVSTANAISGAFLEWANNTTDTGTPVSH